MAQLRKQLGALDVFSVASGAMISSGLFVLPAIAFMKAGPAMILSYLFASILIIPSVLSKAELATAMPRAGGTYFFVERSLGPAWGVFGGLAGWFSLALKSAFAIVGMAVLIEVVLQTAFPVQLKPWSLKAIAAVCCLGFTALNIVSVKHTSRFQVLLVAILLTILACFSVFGVRSVEAVRFKGFLEAGWMKVLATAGLVFVSFGGLTKVASIAEEVRNPGKNLPVGMMLAWFVVTGFYLSVIIITVGVLDGAEFETMYEQDRLVPISLAASKFMGPFGFALLGLAAIAAFVTTANGGLLAASRSPLAMSRDQLLPPVLSHVNERFKTPHLSIALTGGFMIASIVFLDIVSLVKTASTLMIILFILVNTSVIIMRESRIQSYRPKFKSPLYPYIHIFAIVAYSALIIDMGRVPLLITGGFIAVSAGWFMFYVRRHVSRASAVMHVVERVTDHELKTVTLENELRDILLQRDDIIEDRFDQLIRECEIIDIQGEMHSEDIFRQVSKILEPRLDISEYVLFEKFLHREAEGGTVVQPGFAIPHIVVEGNNKFDILLVRACDGIEFPDAPDPVKIMFVMVGSRDERNYHLRALMAIAQIAQEKDFEQRWFAARDTAAIRNLILLSTRKRDTNL
ncbi:MAG: amino acid permease [Planctomycetota bacterium]|jgi:amino acid transporter/mannitol/fructose-specific phosphotransferase system IIA component (Ntr-type)